jgi:hypothetical protein
LRGVWATVPVQVRSWAPYFESKQLRAAFFISKTVVISEPRHHWASRSQFDLLLVLLAKKEKVPDNGKYMIFTNAGRSGYSNEFLHDSRWAVYGKR